MNIGLTVILDIGLREAGLEPLPNGSTEIEWREGETDRRSEL